MAIELKPEHQQVIDSAIRSGAFHDPDEVLDQAFEIIRVQLRSEDWLTEQREAVAAKIALGIAQAERGELMDGEAAIEMLRQRRRDSTKPRK
jgi:antitoxin ParD1/3/4